MAWENLFLVYREVWSEEDKESRVREVGGSEVGSGRVPELRQQSSRGSSRSACRALGGVIGVSKVGMADLYEGEGGLVGGEM